MELLQIKMQGLNFEEPRRRESKLGLLEWFTEKSEIRVHTKIVERDWHVLEIQATKIEIRVGTLQDWILVPFKDEFKNI